jgi:hypothetical protein
MSRFGSDKNRFVTTATHSIRTYARIGSKQPRFYHSVFEASTLLRLLGGGI